MVIVWVMVVVILMMVVVLILWHYHGGGVDTNGEYEPDCGNGVGKVDCGNESEDGGGGDSNASCRC